MTASFDLPNTLSACQDGKRMPRRPRKKHSSVTTHHCCGVIPLRRTRQGLEFLIIQHVGGNHWSFPKGHAEPDETEKQTALRELTEETGVSRCQLLGPKFLERYAWSGTDGQHRKSVTFFLGLIRGRVVPQAGEIRDWRWLPYADARRLITYRQTKDLIDRAWRVVRTAHSLTKQQP